MKKFTAPTEGSMKVSVVRITICKECSRQRLCYLPARLCERCLLAKPEGQALLLELMALSEERTEPTYDGEQNESYVQEGT